MNEIHDDSSEDVDAGVMPLTPADTEAEQTEGDDEDAAIFLAGVDYSLTDDEDQSFATGLLPVCIDKLMISFGVVYCKVGDEQEYATPDQTQSYWIDSNLELHKAGDISKQTIRFYKRGV